MTSVYRGSEPDQIVDGMIPNMKFQIENPVLLNIRFIFDEFLYLDVNFHHFCMNCLQGFTQESSRDQHRVYCEDNESVRVKMPKQGSTIEFKDGQNQFKVPFIMYADFESILELMGPQGTRSLSDPIESPNPNPNQPYTNEVNQHMPSGWCVYSKFAYGDVDNPLRLYRGKDCIETFCNYIKGEAHRLYHMFPELPMDPLTKKQWKKYKKATKCHICYKPFTQTN